MVCVIDILNSKVHARVAIREISLEDLILLCSFFSK